MDKKILLVDDDSNALSFLKDLLENNGYKVFAADNGKSALRILEKETVSVMYFDLDMPQMSGIELCRKIRENNQLAWICAVTGARALFEIAECREAGFDDYFTKPVDIELILKNTSEAFSRFERWKGR
jgi:DNA-binding response OmpR family regulator